MKYFAIFLISLYQYFVSPILKQIIGVPSSCRYQPTCSSFAKTKIQEYGMIKGGKMALKRLLSCHPFANPYGTNH